MARTPDTSERPVGDSQGGDQVDRAANRVIISDGLLQAIRSGSDASWVRSLGNGIDYDADAAADSADQIAGRPGYVGDVPRSATELPGTVSVVGYPEQVIPKRNFIPSAFGEWRDASIGPDEQVLPEDGVLPPPPGEAEV